MADPIDSMRENGGVAGEPVRALDLIAMAAILIGVALLQSGWRSRAG
jgi:hypothetical protein